MIPNSFPRQVCTQSVQGTRAENQDRVAATEVGILAVADGMGGLEAGGEAAEIAIRTVLDFKECDSPRPALRNTFQQANREIWEYGERNKFQGKMGSTLVVCLALRSRYLVANVGDSRCYYVNRSAAWPLTEDHSRAREMVRLGAMSEDAARHSPFRNELTNCLGEPYDVPVDLFPTGEHWGVIDEDCILLVCSDGLHGWVDDAAICGTLLGEPTIEAGCGALIELALKNGSNDNVTISAAEFGHIARTRRGWWPLR